MAENEVKIHITTVDDAATGRAQTRSEFQKLGDDVAGDLDKKLSDGGTKAGKNLSDNVAKGADNVRGTFVTLGQDVDTELSDAGTKAGESLGDGVTRGADGRLRDVRGRFVSLGQDVEKTLGDSGTKAGQGMGDNVKRGATSNAQQTGSLLAGAIGLGVGIGAPVIAGAMIAGVSLGAIGMVAAAQKGNQGVIDSFTGLKTQVVGEIKNVTDQAVPALVASGQQMTQTFANMGPQLQTAFSYAGPDIKIMTDGVDNLAKNAMPGFVSSLQNSQPIMMGVASLMGSVGTTVSTVLTDISSHSQVFGRDITQVGGMVENLGSVVGGVLPGLATGFGASIGAVNGLLNVVKPIAPALGGILGYAAPVYGMFNLFGVAARPIQSMADGLGNVGKKMSDSGYEKFGGTLSTIGSAAGKFGQALPFIGAAVGVVTDIIAASDAKFQQWAADILKGGDSAKQALQDFQQTAGFVPGSFDRIFQGMDPVQKAQAIYNIELANGKTSTLDLAQAQGDLDAAVKKQTQSQDQQNLALIEAKRDMATLMGAVMAQENATLGLVGAQLNLTDAEKNYNDAVKQHGKNSQQAQQAYQAEQQSIMGVVNAAGLQAKANDDLAIQDGKKITASQEAIDQAAAERTQVTTMIGTYALAGKQIPQVLSDIASSMGDASSEAVITAAEVDNVTARLGKLPPGKSVTVKALTAQAIAELEAAGDKVKHLPNGQISITAIDNVTPVLNQVIHNNSGHVIWVDIKGNNQVAGAMKMSATGGPTGLSHYDTGGAVGDLTMNEHGGEAVRLPTGSMVIPNSSADGAARTAFDRGGGGGSGSMEMKFTGTQTAFSTLVMNEFRAGRIQLVANGQRVTVG